MQTRALRARRTMKSSDASSQGTGPTWIARLAAGRLGAGTWRMATGNWQLATGKQEARRESGWGMGRDAGRAKHERCTRRHTPTQSEAPDDTSPTGIQSQPPERSIAMPPGDDRTLDPKLCCPRRSSHERKNPERTRRASVPAERSTDGGSLQIHSAPVRSRRKRLVIENPEQRWLPLAGALRRWL